MAVRVQDRVIRLEMRLAAVLPEELRVHIGDADDRPARRAALCVR